MHITLIHPPALPARASYSALSQPPLGLACLAACLRENGHKVEIIDAVGEAISRLIPYEASSRFHVQGLSLETIVSRIDRSTGLIGFSCMFSHTWPLVRKLINRTARSFPGLPLIAGGEHPTAMTELCLNQAALTACVLGEGEQTLIDFVHALENDLPMSSVAGIAWKEAHTGRIITTPARPPLADLDALPLPAWELVPWANYRLYSGPVRSRAMPLLGSRGCPYQCAFCSAPAMWGKPWRKRSPENIVNEIEQYMTAYGVGEFHLIDISPLISRQWLTALCNLILTRRLDLTWQMPVGNRCEAIDGQTAALMAAAGCRYIQFAPESGSLEVLNRMNKKIDLERFRQAVIAAVKAGMKVCALFIIGYPGETGRDIRRTRQLIRWLARHGVHEIAISSFVLLPGTDLFGEMTGEQFPVDDAFLYQTAGATSFNRTRSWNPPFSPGRLLVLKWLGLAQFYGLSFLLHPRRPARILFNFIRRRQETKIDRVLVEIMTSLKNRLKMQRRKKKDQS